MYLLHFDSLNKIILNYVLDIRQRFIVFKKTGLLFKKLSYCQKLADKNFRRLKFLFLPIEKVLRTRLFLFKIEIFLFLCFLFFLKIGRNNTILAKLGQGSKYFLELCGI